MVYVLTWLIGMPIMAFVFGLLDGSAFTEDMPEELMTMAIAFWPVAFIVLLGYVTIAGAFRLGIRVQQRWRVR